MKLTLAEPKFLKESVAIISELVNDVNLKIDSNSIQVIAMDPANVALVNFQLLSSAFAEYEIEKPIDLSISLDNLKTILKRAKLSDSVILSHTDGDNRLKVELVGGSKRSFSIPLINMDYSDQKIPNLSFSTKVEMPSIQFDDAIEDVGIIAESVAFMIREGKFFVNSENNLSEAKVEILSTEAINISSGDDEVQSKYSLDYLKKIIKGSKLADNVVVEFNKDYPLKVSYTVLDKVHLGFILAPRVSND
ncbi:MAG: proliferating cell nuclear antigen (pcna) [archaeon]